MRSPRERWVTPFDRALLDAIGRNPTVVEASRALGVSRDRAMYRLRRLERWTGRAVVRSRRGGDRRGLTTLTPWGWSLLRAGSTSIGRPIGRKKPVAENRFLGTWSREPEPTVEVGEHLRLRVGFRARPHEPVGVAIDPEAVIVATARFPSSARNVLPGTVIGLVRRPDGTASVETRVAGHVLEAAVTDRSVRELELRRGKRVFLFVKATAIRRVARGG